MDSKNIKRYSVLGILFFLPVVFLLMLIPAKHNYITLDVVKGNVSEINYTSTDSDQEIKFKDHITVLGFIGKEPLKNATEISNLKELIYDKFRGFKKFQIVMIAQEGTENQIEALKKELIDYNTLDYFHFVYASPNQVFSLYNKLKSYSKLDSNLSTSQVFIIDKELNQRGRLEDEDKIRESGTEDKSLSSYNTIEVAELKNKMSDDMRVLFTEYRQKRKGDFNSTIRRAEDISENHVK